MRNGGGLIAILIMSAAIIIWLAVTQFSFLPGSGKTVDPNTGQTVEQSAPIDSAKEKVEEFNGREEMYDNMYEEEKDEFGF